MEEVGTSKGISVIFVLDDIDKVNVSRDMQAAHQCCTDQEVSTAWLSSKECLQLNPKKTDIFVFEEFKGSAFNFLREYKCVIISPRCLMTCLVERKPIPNIPSPIYTIAMVDIVVTASGITKDQKKSLSEKIGLMGGIYLNTFNASVTHLVANAVGSQKYKVAAERGIPVMTEDWVNAVWEAGLKENVSALDPQFCKHKLPVFKGILICASQISKSEKQNLMKIITENGGRYSAQLECKETGVLVITEPSGTKFVFAKKWGIPCVTPKWVIDSSTNGFSLPFEPYLVEGEAITKCSTPKFDSTVDNLPDFSMCSTIVGESSKLNINDTISTDISPMAERNCTPKKKAAGGSKDYINLVNKLDVSEAKKAGSFLDGCKIYLSGFSPSQVEKLRKIINGGGATRFHQMTESVSHVIVGEFVYEEMKTLKSGKFRPFVVSVDWLLESMHRGRVADEEKFLCFDLRPLEPPSPLSKKGLQLLQGGSISGSASAARKINVAESNTVEEEAKPEADDRNLLQQYLGSNGGSQDNSSEKAETSKNTDNGQLGNNIPISKDVTVTEAASGMDEDPEEDESGSQKKLFQGLKFVVAGFGVDEDDEEVYNKEDLQQMLEEYGGQVMVRRFKGIPDYGVVPIKGAQLPCTVGEVVTHLWLEDCHEQEKIVPVEYYHRPFSIEPDCKPLSGCVIGISSYMGKERAFITSLAEALGAYSQEVFSKKDIPEKKAVASTHLICPTPEGNKYGAAVKWGLPAVTKEWVLACAQKRLKVPESDFFVTSDNKNSIAQVSSSTISYAAVKATPAENKGLPLAGQGEERSNGNVSANTASTKQLCKVQTDPNVNEKSTRDALEGQQPSTRTPLPSARILSFSSTKSSSEGNEKCSVDEKQIASRLDCIRKDDDFAGYDFTPPSHIIRHGAGKLEESANRGSSVKRLNPNRGLGGVLEIEKSKEKLSHVSTPETPYGKIFEGDPSKSTQKAWKNWVDNIPRLHQETPQRAAENPQTPFSELKRRLWVSIDHVCENLDAKTKLAPTIDGDKVEEDTTEYKRKRKRIDEPDERDKRNSRPLEGVTVYFWKELPKKQRDDLSIKVESLGGMVLNSLNERVTHAVFMGEESEISEEFKLAKDAGKIIVAPTWVDLCASEGNRMDEALFPPADYVKDYFKNPGVDWESLTSKTQAKNAVLTQGKILRPRSEAVSGSPLGMKKGSLEDLNDSFRKPEVLLQLKKLDHVLAEESSSTPEKCRLSRVSSSSLREERANLLRSIPDSAKCHPSSIVPDSGCPDAMMANPPSPGTQGSVSEVILWQENGGNLEEDAPKEREDQSEDSDLERISPKFMFSSMEDGDRTRYRLLIEELGGSVTGDTYFDIEATHLITLRPARSEKLLGSIASGKWVLHPEYLEECRNQRKFVEEEPYEWGNPDGVIPLPNVEMERVLSEAIHRWRIKIKGSKKSSKKTRNVEGDPKNPVGAFEGVCAIIHMAEERSAAFQRLILAGGGTVSKARPPYSNVSDATLCLVELGRGQGTVDLESLAAKEIPCVKPLYLNQCLTRMESPNPIEFAIPEYLAALKSVKMGT